MEADMTELEAFRRFCVDAGHYAVIAALDRWLSLSDAARQALQTRWAVEDRRTEDKGHD
jgi:hypothetical protein